MSMLAVGQPASSRLRAADVALALAIVLPLAAIIAPYRHVFLPQALILAVAALGGLYCFRLAIVNVEGLFFLFLLYIPFQKVMPGDFGGAARALNFTNALLVLLFLGWVVRPRGLAGVLRAERWTILDVTILLFLSAVTISTVAQALRETGEMRYETLSDLKRWLTPFAVYFLIKGSGITEKTAKKMLLAVAVTTAVIGLLGVKQFWMDMGGGSRHRLDEIRIAVTSGPSNLGAFFAYYLPFIFAMWVGNIGRFAYWALLFPLAWCMDALRVTFSRGAAIAFITAAAAIVWRKSRVVFLLVVPTIAVFLYLNPVTLPSEIFGRMAGTYRSDRPGDTLTDKLDKSAQTRLEIWRGGMQMIRDNPVFGVGYGQFPNQIGAYAPEVAGMDPHNNVLKIAAEMGLPAMGLFVLVIGMCFWKGYRLYGRVEDPLLKAMVLGYVGSAVGLFVANLFGSRLDSEEITVQFWAITAAIALMAERTEANAATPAGEENEYVGG